MKLSLCIATFNEEANIHYPLDCAYDLVDEVIIVDGGSTDKTVEKAKSYGPKVKVFVEDNPPMFHINKQKAIERAKGEWILQLDADEELSDELKEEIRSVVIPSTFGKLFRVNLCQSELSVNSARNQAKRKNVPIKSGLDSSVTSFPQNDKGEVAYYIPRKNWFLTRFLMKGGQYPDYTIRLYKNGVARFPCKSVHENVEVKGEIGYLKSDILHYADPDFDRFLTRWNRYTTLDANLLIKKGEKINFFDYFFVKPTVWFLSTYFRHKGFMDGFPGFVFCLFSSIRFWVIYVKWWLLKKRKL